MNKLMNLASKTISTLQNDGPKKVYQKTCLYLKRRKDAKLEETYTKGCFRDVLFVNGCDEHLPHPGRYRVTHQREQLEALGFSTGEIYYQNIEQDILGYYRTILFFRCPYTPKLEEIVKLAKRLNKTVLYDIDDLVFDTIYTDQIPYLETMNLQERQEYDQNVRNMGELLQLCDGAVTTTECLAKELKKYVPEVVINRNVASEEMVMLSAKALLNRKERNESTRNSGNLNKKIKIGYFSGSITHNDDFNLILPVLAELLDKYKNLELCLAGELDVPEQLKPFENQLVKYPFTSWRNLTEMIAQTDINIAPLTQSVFNEAKSENKWMEAALVKIPTVASDLGAFREMVKNGENGILCRDADEWKEALEALINNEAYRIKLGNAAYEYCIHHCTTAVTGQVLADFIHKKETSNLMLVLPGFQVSGGVMVALQHARILQEWGRDVTLLSIDEEGRENWYSFENSLFPVLNLNSCKIKGRIDWCVATMWSTCSWLDQLETVEQKGYLVQNYEPDFYLAGNPLRMQARATYGVHPNWKYLTISRWCEKWLKEDYGHQAKYAPNGLDLKKFQKSEGDFMTGFPGNDNRKIRILIEGDSSAWHKNVDESFQIAQLLDPEKFEIWYMAYHGTPKDWYRVDHFWGEVPYEKVQEVYQQCDILLKSSVLESFSYPPLEMMASGGLVVAVQNGGNQEYLKDEENCLIYPVGNIQAGVDAILRLCRDEALRKRLQKNGKETAKQRDWSALKEKILNLYPTVK